jgi:hypothetical protein
MRAVNFQADLFPNEAGRPASERILRLLLEALTQSNELYLATHPGTPPLYRSGVRYQREPLGQEDWNAIPIVLARRFGDCEDLAAWRCAEIRRGGGACVPDFFWRLLPGGVLMYHIIVRRSDGRIEDPSRLLGMGAIA